MASDADMASLQPGSGIGAVIRQLLAGHPAQAVTPAPGIYDYGYGQRWVEPGSGEVPAPKGMGWLGPMRNHDGVSTEISVTDDEGRTFPSMVPGMTQKEFGLLGSGRVPDLLYSKAADHAEAQRKIGRGPYFDNNFQTNWQPGDKLPGPYRGSYEQ